MRADAVKHLPIPVALAAIAISTWVGSTIHTGFEDYLRFMVRETAYVSSTFFLLAYLARPLREATGAVWAAVLVRIRRRLGVAAALAHTVHFAFVVSLNRFTGHALDPITLVFGGLGFLLFWLLAITSNDASVRRLGRNWKRLHRVGVHYLWFVFFVTYLGDVGRRPVFAIFVTAFLGALFLRVYLHWRGRVASPAT